MKNKILLAVLLLVIFAVGYLVYFKKIGVVNDWKVYKNTEFKFELKYPEMYTVKETRQGVAFDGTKQFVVVDFVNGDNKLSLQINRDIGEGVGVCRPKVDSSSETNPFGLKIEKKKFTEYVPERVGDKFICEKVDSVSFKYYFGGPFPKDGFQLSGQVVDDSEGLKLEKLADLMVKTIKLD